MRALDINEYKKRLKARYGTSIVAHGYLGVRVPVKHTCKTHGTFIDMPYRGLYSASPCPDCRTESKSRKSSVGAKGSKNTRRIELVKERIVAIKKNKIVKLLTDSKELLRSATSHTDIPVQCLSCGSKFHTNISVAPKLKYGCRACTNRVVNKEKTISPDKILNRLRVKFPQVKILGLDKVVTKQSLAKVIFECGCGTVVTRSRFSFERDGALRMCKVCTFKAIDQKDKGSPVKTARCKDTGKIFRVRGYEIHALRTLKAEGINLSIVKDSSEAESFEYHFQGKTKNYFPDFVYKRQVVEVKSMFTAGLTGDDSASYRRLAMLKAKARACMKQGFKFRLMLYVEIGRSLVEADLPPRWWTLTKEALLDHLEEFRMDHTA